MYNINFTDEEIIKRLREMEATNIINTYKQYCINIGKENNPFSTDGQRLEEIVQLIEIELVNRTK